MAWPSMWKVWVLDYHMDALRTLCKMCGDVRVPNVKMRQQFPFPVKNTGFFTHILTSTEA